MTRTLVGIFTRTEKAELAADGLTAAGVATTHISLSPAVRNDANIAWPPHADGPLFTDDADEDPLDEAGRGARYSQALRQGWTVLTVEVEDLQAAQAADVLRQAGVLELDQLPPAG
ncbi:MAG: hypothetical protein ACK4PH_15045 [Aquincola tertiaricarbonis]